MSKNYLMFTLFNMTEHPTLPEIKKYIPEAFCFNPNTGQWFIMVSMSIAPSRANRDKPTARWYAVGPLAVPKQHRATALVMS